MSGTVGLFWEREQWAKRKSTGRILDQVLGVWERAKRTIRDRLSTGTERPHNVVDRVVGEMGLPEEWAARLESSIQEEEAESARQYERKFLEQEDSSFYDQLR